MNNKRGLTIIEIIISLGLIALIIGIGAPLYQNFYNKNNLNTAANSIAQNLKRAQALASASDEDSNWGIYIQNGNIVIFKGLSYATRDFSCDEETKISEGISLGGLNEIVFSKFSGFPQTTGSINLISPNNDAKTITINEKGIISH